MIRLFRFRARRDTGVIYSTASILLLAQLILYAVTNSSFYLIIAIPVCPVIFFAVIQKAGFVSFGMMELSIQIISGQRIIQKR